MNSGASSFFILLCIIMNAFAAEIQLRNGTVYKGEIIAEDDAFFTMKVGSSNLTINKVLVSKRDGAAYQPAVKTGLPATITKKEPVVTKNKVPAVQNNKSSSPDTLKLPAGEKAASETKKNAVSTVSQPVSKKVIVTAMPGENDSATVVANEVPQPAADSRENPFALPSPRCRVKVTTLSADNPREQSKAVPASVVDSADKYPAVSSASVADITKTSIAQSAPEDNSSGGIKIISAPSPAFVAERRKNSFNNGVAEIASKNVPAGKIMLQSTDSANLAPVTNKVPSISQFDVKTPGIENSTVSVNAKPAGPNVEIVPQITMAAQRPLVTDSTNDNPLPLRSLSTNVMRKTEPDKRPMASPSQQIKYRKRTDDKHDIVLTNGTMFTGTVKGEGKTSIAILVDGAVVTILKRLIKDFDGEPYVYEKPANQKNSSKYTRSSKGRRQQNQAHIHGPVFRTPPAVKLPQDVTVGNIIDSLSLAADWRSRSRALRHLGAMGSWGVSAIPFASKLLADTAQSAYPVPVLIDSSTADEYLAPGLEAARALAQLGSQGVEELVKASKMEISLVRRHALFGLGNCFVDAAVKAVNSALADKDPQVRRCALGSLRINTALPALTSALGDPDGSVRSAAVMLIGKLDDSKSVQSMARMIKDRNNQVRCAVADALGTLGSRQGIPLLCTLSSDSDNFVRAAAVRALGTIRDSASIDVLIAATGDESAEVRASAAEALGIHRNSRAIPLLYAMLKDSNQIVREKAKCAVRLHTEIPLLIDALEDESGTVRSNASYILWLLTGQDFGEDRKEWEVWAAAHPDTNNTLENSGTP